jgi:murein biosynthesis integral membrane protein MurJ
LDRYPGSTRAHSLTAANGVPRIVWIGSPTTAQYLQLLRLPLQALARTQAFVLRVVGSGEDEVDMPGVQVEVVAWSEATEVSSIGACDVGIMPLQDSPWERGKCGYKLIQYMACGLPVVASDVGVNPEIVQQGVNGFLARSHDDWLLALQQLLSDPSLRERMGQAGRQRVEQRYCLQRTGPRVVNWLRQAAEGAEAIVHHGPFRAQEMTALSPEMSLRGSLKSSFFVAMISGLAGMVVLLQDMVIANHFATGGAADAYQLATSFPLLALNVFAGGTLLAVLVPLLTQFVVDGRALEAEALVKRARRVLGWLLLAVCGIWALIYPHVAVEVATGFSADTLSLSAHLLWLVVPVLFFAGLASVDAAVLNSRRRFGFISTLPAFMPAGVVVCIFLLEARLGIYAAALGLLFGSAMQWLASRRLAMPLLHHAEPSPVPVPPIARLVRDYGMAAASAALLAGILMTDTFMASAQPAGSTAAYGYGVRPVILLLAFITTVVGNVVLPYFSHLAAIADWRALKKQVLFWFGLLAMGAVPVVGLWYIEAADFVTLLYQRGAFGPSDTAKVAAVQQIYLLQIPFYLVGVIGWRVMNSLNRHTAMLVISAVGFVANLAADLWLAPSHGLEGIAWGTNLAFALWAILITLYLLRVHGKMPPMHGAETSRHPLTQSP